MTTATPEEQAAVAAFQRDLQRVLRDLAGLVGLGRRDLPLARAALVLFGLAAFRAGRAYERAQQPPQERQTVRRPHRRHMASGTIETPAAGSGWPETGEETPLADARYPPTPLSQPEVDLTDMETSPGFKRPGRRS